MKKNYLLMLGLLLSTFIYGQNSSTNFWTNLKNKSINKQSIQEVIGSHYAAYRTAQLETKQKLDSILIIDTIGGTQIVVYKELYNYDTYGNNTSYISYDFDGSSLIYDSKDSLVYDINHRLISLTHSNWSNMANQWTDEYRYNITYTSNTIEYIHQDWSGTWDNNTKISKTMNSSNQITQEIQYVWDTTSSSWTKNNKSVYFYNTNNNKIDSILVYNWSSMWDNSMKEVYTYDSNLNNTKIITYQWVASQWRFFEKTDSKFDSNNMITSSSTSHYTTNNVWEYTDSTFYSNQGNDIDYYEYFDWNGSAWDSSYKEDYTHNTSYSFTDLLLPFHFQDDETTQYFTHMLTKVVAYEYNTGGWEEDVTIDLYYSGITISSIALPKQESIKIYPNPTNDFINIANPSNTILNMYIFDISGKKVMQESIKTNKRVDISKLKGGVYLIQLMDETETIYSKKLIKY